MKFALSNGQLVTVDEEDADLARFPWHANKGRTGGTYAKRSEMRARTVTRYALHRVIAERMGLEIVGLDVDHINGDGLDNRRENLRALSRSHNNWNITGLRKNNTSGFMGVCFNKQAGRWMGYIKRPDGKRQHCGFHDTADAANRAVLAKELELRGIQPRRAAAHAAVA